MNHPSNSSEIYVKHVILERIKFKIQQKLDELHLSGITFDLEAFTDIITYNYIQELRLNILGEKNVKEVKIPSSWWQMFKQQYLPERFLKRYPVQSKCVGLFEYLVLYPHLKISLPEERRYISVTKFDSWKIEDSIKKDYKKLLI